jgi:uncharacterized membrane protein YeaQ/YmgE (transglycosylase-associated protein family)
MGLIWTCVIGLIVGAVAKMLMPGKDPGGMLITMGIGIAGSFVGTWLGQAVGWYTAGAQAGFIASLVGALLLLGVYHLVKSKTSATP